MNKKLIFFLGILSAFEVHAQKVVPLFRDDSIVTQVAIPFAFQNNSQQAIEITQLKVTSVAGKCIGMIDPFIPSDPMDPTPPPDYSEGAMLYSQKCAGCHVAGNMRTTTPKKITDAIARVFPDRPNVMANIVLTNAQKQAISLYLQNLP